MSRRNGTHGNGTNGRTALIDAALPKPEPTPAPLPKVTENGMQAAGFLFIRPPNRPLARIWVKVSAITQIIDDGGLLEGPHLIRVDGQQVKVTAEDLERIKTTIAKTL